MSSNDNCNSAREIMSRAAKLPDDYAIYFFAKNSFFDGHPRSEELVPSLEHIRTCPSCQSWLKEQVPHETFTRQERITRYCCVMMFCAVEEGRTHQIKLGMFRGEDPCWMIDGMWSGISFCPWCGERLPNHPFIPEE